MGKPETIPADVERRAFKMAIDFRKSELEDGVHALALTHVIAGAILAERNRCITIASPLPIEADDSDYEKQAHDIRAGITDQIRSGKPLSFHPTPSNAEAL